MVWLVCCRNLIKIKDPGSQKFANIYASATGILTELNSRWTFIAQNSIAPFVKDILSKSRMITLSDFTNFRFGQLLECRTLLSDEFFIFYLDFNHQLQTANRCLITHGVQVVSCSEQTDTMKYSRRGPDKLTEEAFIRTYRNLLSWDDETVNSRWIVVIRDGQETCKRQLIK